MLGFVFLLSGKKKKHWSLYREPSSIWYLILYKKIVINQYFALLKDGH